MLDETWGTTLQDNIEAPAITDTSRPSFVPGLMKFVTDDYANSHSNEFSGSSYDILTRGRPVILPTAEIMTYIDFKTNFNDAEADTFAELHNSLFFIEVVKGKAVHIVELWPGP